METELGILHKLLNETFNKSTIQDIENYYVKDLKHITKWTCYSDYCLDNKTKPNDTLSFTLVPYVDDFQKLGDYIKLVAKKDIKKVKFVSQEYLEFLKKYPIINFSFIINDRKRLYGNNITEIKTTLQNDLNCFKEKVEYELKVSPLLSDYYKTSLAKTNRCLNFVENSKKLNLIIDMILITFFGSYVSSIVLSKLTKIEKFGWFSDRDKIMDLEDGFAIDIFNSNISGLLEKQKFDFISTNAKSTSSIFYENFIKLPD